MKNKTSVVWFGNEQLAQGLERAVTPSFETLIRERYEIRGVVLPSENKKNPFEIVKVAERAGVRVYYAQTTDEILELTRKLGAEVGVLASFGKIIPEAVIEAFPLGILNIHPSLLPKYRGTTPIESAILNGDKETGVSVMGLIKEMDAGPIYAQEKLALRGNESKQAVYEQLAEMGAKLLIRVLKEVVEGDYEPTEQDESQASFTQKLDKRAGWLRPEEFGAAELERQVRAYAGFPKSKYEFFGIACAVVRAYVGDGAGSELDLKCKDGKYLCIDQLVPAGRKVMGAADFLRGYTRR